MFFCKHNQYNALLCFVFCKHNQYNALLCFVLFCKHNQYNALLCFVFCKHNQYNALLCFMLFCNHNQYNALLCFVLFCKHNQYNALLCLMLFCKHNQYSALLFAINSHLYIQSLFRTVNLKFSSFSQYIISLNNINWLVFVMEIHCVFCELGTEFLNVIAVWKGSSAYQHIAVIMRAVQ
jgi:hypothetical protein